MPAFQYLHSYGAFTKQCSHCKEVFVGTANKNESVLIFNKIFAPSNSAGMADGMQSRCFACNAYKRRSLGITRQILSDMFNRQGGKCAICCKEITIQRGADASIHAHVDHDESTNKVRELLCGACNRGIGMFLHDANRLKAAAAYVIKHASTIAMKRRM